MSRTSRRQIWSGGSGRRSPLALPSVADVHLLLLSLEVWLSNCHVRRDATKVDLDYRNRKKALVILFEAKRWNLLERLTLMAAVKPSVRFLCFSLVCMYALATLPVFSGLSLPTRPVEWRFSMR